MTTRSNPNKSQQNQSGRALARTPVIYTYLSEIPQKTSGLTTLRNEGFRRLQH